MKKIIAVVSVFAVAALASAAFASDGWIGGDDTTKIYVSNDNNAVVNTKVATISNTGLNSANATVMGESEGSVRAKGGNIVTGEAVAVTDVLVGVNANNTEIDATGCGCERDGDTYTKIKVNNRNNAVVETAALTVANTGLNSANAKVMGESEGSVRAKGGNIVTGDASALTTVGVVANSNWTTITK